MSVQMSTPLLRQSKRKLTPPPSSDLPPDENSPEKKTPRPRKNIEREPRLSQEEDSFRSQPLKKSKTEVHPIFDPKKMWQPFIPEIPSFTPKWILSVLYFKYPEWKAVRWSDIYNSITSTMKTHKDSEGRAYMNKVLLNNCISMLVEESPYVDVVFIKLPDDPNNCGPRCLKLTEAGAVWCNIHLDDNTKFKPLLPDPGFAKDQAVEIEVTKPKQLLSEPSSPYYASNDSALNNLISAWNQKNSEIEMLRNKCMMLEEDRNSLKSQLERLLGNSKEEGIQLSHDVSPLQEESIQEGELDKEKNKV